MDAQILWVKVDTANGQKLLFSGPKLDISTAINVRLANPSEFLLFSDYLNTFPTQRADLIVEVLGSGSTSSDHYKGHDYNELAKIFDPVYIIESEDVKELCASKIILDVCAKYSYRHRGEHVSDFITLIFNKKWSDCEFEQAKMLSLLHNTGPMHFLIQYWILESFFFAYAAKSFYKSVKPAVSEKEFFLALEREIDWRPKEIVAFTKLTVDCIPVDMQILLCEKIIKKEEADKIEPGNRCEFIAKSVYSFRNALVHSRHKEQKPSEAEIKKFTCIAVEIIETMLIKNYSDAIVCTCGTKVLRDQSR